MKVLTLLLITLAILADGHADKRNFATSLFLSLAHRHKHQSFVICPLSVRSSLVMFLLNSEGATKRELLTSLHLKDLPKRTLLIGIQALQKRLAGGITFKTRNRLFLNNDTKVLPLSINVVSKFLATDAVTTFFGLIESTKAKIADWVATVSGNAIKSTVKLQPPEQQQQHQLQQQQGVLVCVATFKALWEKSFPENGMMKHDFTINATSTVQTDMMTQVNVFPFAESRVLDAKIVVLPLFQSSITLLLILPNRVDGLQRLVCKLKRVNIQKIALILQPKLLQLTLPRFKFVSDVKLRASLRFIGIRSLFQNPEIFGLTQNNRTTLTEVVHKVAFEIDELGGTATSETVVEQKPEANFTAGHPFVFYVRDIKTIYFAGHIVNV